MIMEEQNPSQGLDEKERMKVEVQLRKVRNEEVVEGKANMKLMRYRKLKKGRRNQLREISEYELNIG